MAAFARQCLGVGDFSVARTPRTPLVGLPIGGRAFFSREVGEPGFGWLQDLGSQFCGRRLRGFAIAKAHRSARIRRSKCQAK
jgi:hypothetical protein